MKVARSDNKTLREQSSKLLISQLLESQNEILMDREKTLLFEVLCNQKSFAELTDVMLLSTHRQKVIFNKAVEKLSAYITDFNKKLSSLNKLEDELKDLKTWKTLLESSLKAQKETEEEIDPALKKLLLKNIADLKISERVKSVCRYGNLITVSDLVSSHRHDLLQLRNCGGKTIGEIENFLEVNGLWWGMNVP